MQVRHIIQRQSVLGTILYFSRFFQMLKLRAYTCKSGIRNNLFIGLIFDFSSESGEWISYDFRYRKTTTEKIVAFVVKRFAFHSIVKQFAGSELFHILKFIKADTFVRRFCIGIRNYRFTVIKRIVSIFGNGNNVFHGCIKSVRKYWCVGNPAIA